MRAPHHASAKGSKAQTTRDDFRRIFSEEMESLYLLSLLLTADQKKAEHCFVAGMEDCVQGNPVFKKWAHAWGRRAIIKTAIRIVSPLTQPAKSSELALNAKDWATDLRPAIAAVTQLPSLERFVYVMSVLERYSDHECSTMLNTSKQQVIVTRSRALQHLSVGDGTNPSPAEIVNKLLAMQNQIAL